MMSSLRSRWALALLIVVLAGIVVGVILANQSDSDVQNGKVHHPRYPSPAPVTFIPPTPLPSATPLPDPLIGGLVPDYTLDTLDGSTMSLRGYAGEVLFLNFWATWCDPCKEEMPMLQAMQEQGIRVLTITDPQEGQTEADIRAFMDRYQLTLPVGLSSDPNLYNTFGVEQIPTTFVIDKEGIVRFRHIGPLHEEDIPLYMNEVLGNATDH